ncbi:hypothetical protein [Enterococcus sp. AZ196]|uniref:hypothetical protein n=1 Tax=Enterococcus sp. AZ196 TaxID=2774659 RepID=UPI003D294EBD
MTDKELKEMNDLGIPFLQVDSPQNIFVINLAIGILLILIGLLLLKKSKLKHKSIIGWLLVATGLTACFTKIIEWIN